MSATRSVSRPLSVGSCVEVDETRLVIASQSYFAKASAFSGYSNPVSSVLLELTCGCRKRNVLY